MEVAVSEVVGIAEDSEFSFESLTQAYLQVELVERAALVTKLGVLAKMDAHCAAVFLCIEFGMHKARAERLVFVARALESLPVILDAFAQGHLQWAKVKYLVDFATPLTDAELAEEAQYLSLKELETRSQAAKVDPTKHEQAHHSRNLTFSENDERVLIRGSLPLELGMIVRARIEREADKEGLDEVTGGYRPQHLRNADALVQMCSEQVASDSDPGRATVSVVVQASDIHDDSAVGYINNRVIPMDLVREMLCDCRYQVIKEVDGVTVGVGRMARSLPPALEREMKRRDRGCRFPGCHAVRYVHGHHIVFWSEEGETDLDNLVSLCARHHHLLHGGKWRIEGNPNRRIEFIAPSGRRLDGRLPSALPQTKESIGSLLKRAMASLN